MTYIPRYAMKEGVFRKDIINSEEIVEFLLERLRKKLNSGFIYNMVTFADFNLWGFDNTK